MTLNEYGRSMVEMLGVLAIAAVLSIGGIYGYRQMMIQREASNIWQNLMMWATLIRGIPDYDATHTREKPIAIQFSNTKSDYKMAAELQENVWAFGVFSITVDAVPQEVCEKVIDMRPDELISIIKPSGSAGCNVGKQTMAFWFDVSQRCASRCQKWTQQRKEYCARYGCPYSRFGHYCAYWPKATDSCPEAFGCNIAGHHGTGWGTVNREDNVCPN